MFDLSEVLALTPTFAQPYTLILALLSTGKADHTAFVRGYTGSLSDTPIKGVGPRYFELGKTPSSGAGSARRLGCSLFFDASSFEESLATCCSPVCSIVIEPKVGGTGKATNGDCTTRLDASVGCTSICRGMGTLVRRSWSPPANAGIEN